MDLQRRHALAASEAKVTEGMEHHHQNRNSKAESLLREALEWRRRIFPGNHPEVATVLNNLGLALGARGDIQGAEQFFRDALQMYRQACPSDHPEVATILNNLGWSLWTRGDRQGAELLVREGLEMKRRLSPGDHSRLAVSLNNLGTLLADRGDLQGAESFYREALEMLRRLFPQDHPKVAIALGNLGSFLGNRGNHQEARTLLRQGRDMSRRLCVDDHPDLAWSLGKWGTFLARQGDFEEAEPPLRGALEMNRRLFPEGHSNVATSLSDLAWTLEKRGKVEEAEALFREALQLYKRFFPSDHPYVATALNNLAFSLEQQGNLGEAEQLFREGLDLKRRPLHRDHSAVATGLHNLARVLHARGDIESARRLFREALDMYRRLLPGDHANVEIGLTSLALALEHEGNFEEVTPLLREALEMARRLYPGSHPVVAARLKNLASHLLDSGDLRGAEPIFLEALEMVEVLRPRVVGDERDRAAFSSRLNLRGLTVDLVTTLVRLGRTREACWVSERGRGRTFLDLLDRQSLDLVAAARERAGQDAQSLQRLDAALQREDKARVALTAAEALLDGLQKERKTTERLEGLKPGEREKRLAETDGKIQSQLEAVKSLRRALSDAGAAVLVELRGLFPEARPLSSEEILAALPKGDLVLGYLWAGERVVLVTAGDRETGGAMIAGDKERYRALADLAQKVRSSIAVEPRNRSEPMDLPAARELLDALLPGEARDLARRARRLVVLSDGPLRDLPFEILLWISEDPAFREKPVIHAASATVYLNRLAAARKASGERSLKALVLGDPVYDRDAPPEPEQPKEGVLVLAAAQGSNAAEAGLRRGDVLLEYDGTKLETQEALRDAIGKAEEAHTKGERPDKEVALRYWRDGQSREARVKPGKLGAQIQAGDVASALRSLARQARGYEKLAAEVSATDQVRLFGGSLTRLPGTRREVLSITEVFRKAKGDAEVLLGDAATVAKLSALAPGQRYLHLATHGLTGSAERPYDASLALTRPRDVTPDDIGFLRLDDLIRGWRGKLEGCDLVVLSACDTQRGVKAGESVLSLPWGFFYAGATTVVASLWKVDDEATSLLMARFYENLLGGFEKPRTAGGEEHAPGKGMPPEPALREARGWLQSLSAKEAQAARDRLEALVAAGEKIAAGATEGKERGPGGQPRVPTATKPEDGPPYQHPYYWAAFVCVGSPD
ncbi:MAG: tetratricopeptide repeat protein [Planctomycetes bacterium]|nr:tetratricopeptide repeat protein [Planctomycetota bacterium]